MYANPPVFLPFIDNAAIISVGLRPLASEHWIALDNQFEHYARNKLELHKLNSARVYAQHSCSTDAQRELAQLLYTHLQTQHHGHLLSLNRQGTATHNINDLWQASLWIQDDICLLQQMNNQYCLTAASLCAPSEWNLAEKMGKPIESIHAPVPDLNARVGKQINNTFKQLRPLKHYQRFNWSLKPTNQLALFPGQTPDDTVERIFLRVERQSLMRLPSTKAIAFTIRVYIYPIALIAEQPNTLAALKKAISQMSDAEMQYKSMHTISHKFMQTY